MTKTVNKSYPKDIQKIHENFLTYADTLAKESLDVITKPKKTVIGKTERLNKFGFNQCKDIIDERKEEIYKANFEVIQKYRIKYPNYKFIDKNGVENICKKHGLVFGDTTRYKGFVPDKNLKDIEEFERVKNLEDIPYTHNWDAYMSSSRNRRWKDGEKIVEAKYDDEQFKRYSKLLIVAPISDMLFNPEELQGFEIVEPRKDDPIVLQPVHGGYLIITMWADEQFDPFTESTLIDETKN